jgi:hypothetical protein
MITRLLNIFTEQKTGFVTQKRECKVQVTQKSHSRGGVLSDEIIQVEVDKGSMKTKIKIKKKNI